MQTSLGCGRVLFLRRNDLAISSFAPQSQNIQRNGIGNETRRTITKCNVCSTRVATSIGSQAQVLVFIPSGLIGWCARLAFCPWNLVVNWCKCPAKQVASAVPVSCRVPTRPADDRTAAIPTTCSKRVKIRIVVIGLSEKDGMAGTVDNIPNSTLDCARSALVASDHEHPINGCI